MSVGYRTVQWLPFKRRYDAAVAVLVLLYLVVFVVVGRVSLPPPHEISEPILLMRALGTCALVMLHVVLCIGPLARLDRRFLPLLYNRRHLGVATFFVALGHAAVAVGFYHGFGDLSPPVSLLTSNTRFGSLAAFPFELLGLLGLVMLFLMAATSHDFWLKNLSPRIWKALHMLVYPAWALLVLHVALGALQSEHDPWLAVLLLAGVAIVASLHVVSGWRELRREKADGDGWIDIAAMDDLKEEWGRVVSVRGRERIALFRHEGRVRALSNVCAHQGGPLGEGRIVDGCVTCPWHGYQYRAEDGCSPPPFTEWVATYDVRVVAGRVLVRPTPRERGPRADLGAGP